jgi:DNA modification methylase
MASSKGERRRPRSWVRDRIVELVRVPAGELAPNERNWRRHPERQRAALRALLRDIGYADALLARRVEGRLVLIDGHLRQSLTPTQPVPVLVLDLDDEEADLLLATLDPLASWAEADEQALARLLGKVETSERAVRALLDDLGGTTARPALGDPDAVPEAAEPRCQKGEVWALGDHRLACGDATEAADVARLLGKDRPGLCVSDPPYGVSYQPGWREDAARAGRLAYAARRTAQVTNDDRSDWGRAFELSGSDVVYCWHAGLHTAEVQRGLESAGYVIRSQIIWAKPHLPISRGHYHWRHEPCLYAVRRGSSAHWTGGRGQTTVWEIPLDPAAQGGHGAQKPVEAMERPIRNHDATVVYDPFVGSGTTIIAAERAGRSCRAMDVEPGWCDVAIARWEAFTGRRARRLR